MRTDALGLFWEDLPKPKQRKDRIKERGPHPPIPSTGWRPPTEFPNLSAARVLGLDTETYDPELTTAGPGWGRGRGHLVGVSLAVQDGTSWYFPMRHETAPELNMDPEQVLRYLRHTLGTDIPKVGANLLYDLGWLTEERVDVQGSLYDVQYAEALLNSEAPNVALDALALEYLGQGKVTNELYEWLALWLGGKPNEKQRAYMYLTPPQLAGPYAEADASLPVRVLEKQWPRMQARGVLELFDIECRLIPLLMRMRMKGAPVDVGKTERLHAQLGETLQDIELRLRDISGGEVNPNAADSMKAAFDRVGLAYPTKVDNATKETKVTFDAGRLEAMDHPLAATVLEYRRTAKVRDTFLNSYLLNKNVNGRVHCSFHPLKSDQGGARSGRFASSDPNLQNIPVRTQLGRQVRECFVATGVWKKADYSQIEYRMLAHHATGPGSDELREAYNSDPDIDYHDRTTELVRRNTGLSLPRANIKNINFGLIYGMTEARLAMMLGLTTGAAKELFGHYHTAAPYAKHTMDSAAQEVHRDGYVETVLGRKSDFTRWESRSGKRTTALPYAMAAERWGAYNIKRAATHKALNRKLQGGAADVMKKAMVEAYESGLFDEQYCGIPLLTVHDELDFDDVNDPDGPWWAEFKRVMENAVPQMKVPVRLDIDVGPTWGSAK